MFSGRFSPKHRVVWVEVSAFGPLGQRDLRFILDTGTPVTVIDPAVADELGYSARMGTRSRLLGVDGIQEGYKLEIARLETMGLVVEEFEVWCHDFDDTLGVDGLIGMD